MNQIINQVIEKVKTSAINKPTVKNNFLLIIKILLKKLVLNKIKLINIINSLKQNILEKYCKKTKNRIK